MKLKNVFQRREVKYTMTYTTYENLRKAMDGHMQEDIYGLHTIYSLYYDTNDFSMIRHSIEKPDYKEKFRVRSYGSACDTSNVFLEIKKKVSGIVYKRRIEVPYISLADKHTFKENQSQIGHEIAYIFDQHDLEPKVMIAYERRALYSEIDEEFRVTFDFNIRYSQEDFSFHDNATMARVTPDIDVLMEVKALGSYPVWFSKALSQLGIYKTNYSKYANVYSRYILPSLIADKQKKEKYLGENIYV